MMSSDNQSHRVKNDMVRQAPPLMMVILNMKCSGYDSVDARVEGIEVDRLKPLRCWYDGVLWLNRVSLVSL